MLRGESGCARYGINGSGEVWPPVEHPKNEARSSDGRPNIGIDIDTGRRSLMFEPDQISTVVAETGVASSGRSTT